jgi:hypothetical protein
MIINRKNFKSPFKDSKELLDEIKRFTHYYAKSIRFSSDRTSALFEMTCLNSVVKYYKNNGFSVFAENLREKNEFRYKQSPKANPDNFSYFRVRRVFGKNKAIFEYEIHGNLSVETSIIDEALITPDVIVIKRRKIDSSKKPLYGYFGIRSQWYVKNKNVVTFFEIKHHNPFPELIFSFLGMVTAIKSGVAISGIPFGKKSPKHLAPTLILSGRANHHCRHIGKELGKKFCINIISGLFSAPGSVYSKKKTPDYNVVSE